MAERYTLETIPYLRENKNKNERVYAPGWYRVFDTIKSLSKGSRGGKAAEAKLKKLAKLELEVAKLRSELRANCPHPSDKIEMTKYSNEDTMGSYTGTHDEIYVCRLCSTHLLHLHVDRLGGTVEKGR